MTRTAARVTRTVAEGPTEDGAERRPPVVVVAVLLARGTTRALGRPAVTGALPATGGCVVACNHLSLLDPLLLGAAADAAGRVPRFLAAAGLWSIPGVGAAFRAGGQLPVHRGGPDAAGAVGAAVAAARAGRCVVVYPEGHLGREAGAWPGRFHTGAARIAAAAGVPLVPAAVTGPELVLPPGTPVPRPWPRRALRVGFGEPLAPEPGALRDRAAARAATDRLRVQVLGLLAALRGVPPPPAPVGSPAP